MTICKACNQDLPDDKFGKSYHVLASGERKAYLRSTCMVCYRNKHMEDPAKREIHRKGSSNWYKNNPQLAKNQRLRKYGITLDQYNDLRQNQNYKCAICNKHETTVAQGRAYTTDHALHVDHCHDSGKIRGLLCTNCNTILGKCHDNPDVLKNAINYLTRSTE